MNNKNYILKLSAIVGLAFGLSLGAVAAPDIYLTSKGSLKLKYAPTSEYQLAIDDQVIWQKFEANGTPVSGTEVPKTYALSLEDVALELSQVDAAALELGSHYYKASIITANPASCGGDVSDAVEIYRLPDLEIALSTMLLEYCIDATTPESEVIATASAKEGATIPAEALSFNYDWEVDKGGVKVDPVSGIGTIEHQPAVETSELTTSFTLTTKDIGTYGFVANVKYAELALDGKTIKGASLASSITLLSVKVTPQLGKPTITID